MRKSIIVVVTLTLLIHSGHKLFSGNAKALPVGIRQEKRINNKNGDQKMDAEWILKMARLFLSRDFGGQQVYEMFGPVKLHPNPDSEYLAPKVKNVEAIKVNWGSYEGQRVPEYIAIELLQPSRIDFDSLLGALGAPKEIPRLHPSEPLIYSFDMVGKDFKGYLSVGVTAAEGRLRDLKSVMFVRYLR